MRKITQCLVDKYVSLENRLVFLEKLRIIAEWIDIERKVTACRDVKDDRFLEVAVR